jgi:hypothetical protein
LKELVTGLEGEFLQAGVQATLTISNEELRAQVLVALAPCLGGAWLLQGLQAALGIKAERFRATALAALAPRLTGDLLHMGMQSAYSIQDARERAKGLAEYLPNCPNTSELIGDILYAIIEALSSMVSEKRATVLDFCSRSNLFVVPILSQEIIASIACHTSEICNKWTWL